MGIRFGGPVRTGVVVVVVLAVLSVGAVVLFRKPSTRALPQPSVDSAPAGDSSPVPRWPSPRGADPAPAPAVPSATLAPGASPPPIGAATEVAARRPPADNKAAEAIRARPERFAALASPTAFDPAVFAKDPDTYCAQVIPGRIWQVAQPGKDVPQLSTVGEASFQTTHGGTVTLSVKAAPGAPVTYHSCDLGGFPNGATTITVRADDQGIASIPWIATPGTTGACHILAACPLTSGQVELFIDVQD